MNPTELLFLLSTLGVGGSEWKMVRVANALARSGCSVQLAYLNPPETLKQSIEKSVRVVHLRRRGKYSVSTLLRLASVAREQRFALIAVNLYPLLYAIPAAKYLSRRSLPVIGTINTAAVTKSLKRIGPIYAPFLRRCDRIVFGCHSEMAQWTEQYKLPAGRCEVIYNGVDTVHFSPNWRLDIRRDFRARLGIPEHAMVVGTVGRLAPEKNLNLLLSAVARLKSKSAECHLVLVGEGSERAALEILAANLGIGARVRFLGMLDDVRPAISMMDVFVLPSKEVETFSNAALEAMSMECPVILSDLGGAREMVVNGESGLLFKIGDMDGLCEAICTLCESPELRHRIGRLARSRVMSMFTFAQMVARYGTFASI